MSLVLKKRQICPEHLVLKLHSIEENIWEDKEKHKDEIDENTNLYILLSITTKKISVLLL